MRQAFGPIGEGANDQDWGEVMRKSKAERRSASTGEAVGDGPAERRAGYL